MAAYFATRLEKGKLNYHTVAAKYPECREELDRILAADGYVVNPDGTVTKSN